MKRKTRWIILVLACVIGALIAFTAMGWDGWVYNWIGKLFRAASGGALGWAVSRYVVGLDLSAIPADKRPLAGLSQALLIGFGALAAAV